MMPNTFLGDVRVASRDIWGVETTWTEGRARRRTGYRLTPERAGLYSIIAQYPQELTSYQTGTSFERLLAQIGQQGTTWTSDLSSTRDAIRNSLSASATGFQIGTTGRGGRPRAYYLPEDVTLQRLLSGLVVNPMGYRPDESGLYGWGELAAIYQTTPTLEIAKQVTAWREGGQKLKADLAELYYGATARVPEAGTSQQGNYPLRYGAGLSVFYPQLRTGQRDVKLDPGLVARLSTERPMHRAQKRRYKGGTRVAGALSAIELGKRKLGE